MTMDMKRGKVFVGAVVAISLGSFAVPFGSIASASTGTGSAPQASRFVQLAQAEQSETEEKTERKVTETDNPAMPPNVTVVAPGTAVIAPAAPPVVTMPRTEEHVERKDVQKSTSTDALGMNSSSQRQMDKSSTDINADGSVQQNEEHVTKEKVENND
jgi:hypothetical protein